MPPFAVEALRCHRIRQLTARIAAGRRWNDGDFVFIANNGQPLDGVNVTRRFQDALARIGLPRQRFHDLRHAYAPLSRQAGVPLPVISQSLGHSHYSTTVDIYSHLMTPEQQEAAARIETLPGSRPEVVACR